jgi:hypothetical protein
VKCRTIRPNSVIGSQIPHHSVKQRNRARKAESHAQHTPRQRPAPCSSTARREPPSRCTHPSVKSSADSSYGVAQRPRLRFRSIPCTVGSSPRSLENQDERTDRQTRPQAESVCPGHFRQAGGDARTHGRLVDEFGRSDSRNSRGRGVEGVQRGRHLLHSRLVPIHVARGRLNLRVAELCSYLRQ